MAPKFLQRRYFYFASLLLLVALHSIPPVCARGAHALPGEIRAALASARIPDTSLAIVVQPVDATHPILAHNRHEAMNPASVMKLLTTYAALDLLGPAHTWRTDALVDRLPANGQLTGNLYLRGQGDPKLALEHFTALLRQIRVRGLQQLDGDLVLDRSAFALPPSDPAAFDGKAMRPYNVAPDALLINFQSLHFRLIAADRRVQLVQETPSAGLQLDNRIGWDDTAVCASDWKDQIQTRLLVLPEGFLLEFSGKFSRSCGEKNLHLAPLVADAHVAGLFRALWSELGGHFGGRVRPGSTPVEAKLLAVHESPPLTDIVRDINKFSNNVMARQLYLTLAGNGVPRTIENASRTLKQWLSTRNLLFPELVIENGSGLSRQERISANSLNRLLLDAWKNPVMPDFLSSLPIAGMDGTMRQRLQNPLSMGRARIKTGTLDGVKSAAGYVLNPQGRWLCVTVLINHPNAQLGQPAIDALLLWAARERIASPPVAQARQAHKTD